MSVLDLDNLINDSIPFFPETLLLSTEDVVCLSKKVDQLTQYSKFKNRARNT